MQRILILGEGITLAHVGRSLVIAQYLHQLGHHTTFGFDPRFRSLVGDIEVNTTSITSSSRSFRRITRGDPIFSAPQLLSMVQEDLQLIDNYKPDIIVGDMRWSLSISARKRDIPYVKITNAYFQDKIGLKPIGYHPLLQLLGYHYGMDLGFRLIKPMGFAFHSAPLNLARLMNRMPIISWDYFRVWMEADHVWYCDLPSLFPEITTTDNQGFIGPISWEPKIEFPHWWQNLNRHKPIIYLGLGSSGKVALLKSIVDELLSQEWQLVVATADRATIAIDHPNLFTAKYLPGSQVCAIADLVINNGGSTGNYQALTRGTPVIGIPRHMEAHLAIQVIERAGAGKLLRMDEARKGKLKRLIEEELASHTWRKKAFALKSVIEQWSYPERLEHLLSQIY